MFGQEERSIVQYAEIVYRIAFIWKVIAFLSAAVVLYAFTDHMKELYIVRNGSSIEAVYDKNTMVAKCFDENGKWHIYDLSGYYPAAENGHVTLYYMKDIQKAQPRNSAISRIGFYLLFISIFAVSVWRILRIYGFRKIC